jgi:hypothetical protein
MKVDTEPRLGPLTLAVLRVLIEQGRPMFNAEVSQHLPALTDTSVSQCLVRLRRMGWVESQREPKGPRNSRGGRRTYNRVTLIGRVHGHEALRRAGTPTNGGGVLGELIRRCETAAVAVIEHRDRALIAAALADAGRMLVTVGRDVAFADPRDVALGDQLTALGKVCIAAASQWVTGPGDRDQAWGALRHVVQVLRHVANP